MERRNNNNKGSHTGAFLLGALAVGAGVGLYNWLKKTNKNEKPDSDDEEIFERSRAIDIPKELGITEDEYTVVLNYISDEYLCTISCDLLYDPYTLKCGHSFNHYGLKQWMDRDKTCPQCREPINSKYIVKNFGLKRVVEARATEILKQHKLNK